MADHQEFLDLAREMIEEEGRLVTFQQLDKTPADPDYPWEGPGAPTVADSVQTYAVFVPDAGSGLGKLIEDNELFKSAEQVLLVAPPATGETLGDFHIVVDDAVRWKIDVAKELKPGPLTVLYVMGVSR
jgi:hypothetical protein